MARRVALLGVPLCVLILVGWYLFAQRPASAPVIGRPAPEFRLPSLDSSEISLEQSRGHPVLINFWATWCEPCKAEMPELDATARRHPELRVYGIDNAESPVKVKPFVEQLGITFPILIDLDDTVVERYRVIGTPSSFFIDRDSVLRASYVGPMDATTLQKNLAAIGVT